MLQEARGDLAGHPSYRRYHYAEGPLSVTDASGARFIGTDALGSTTDLTTTSGAVATAHKYDAWGGYRDGTAPGSTDAKLGYTGHQYDPETGLVYARARYYDPELGIFLSRDSYEGEQADGPSLHRYAYAYGNPLGYVDEYGNAAVDAAGSWEEWQRKHAYTGEKIIEQAVAPNSQAILNWAERAGPHGSGFWKSAGRLGMGTLGVVGATLNDAVFGVVAGFMDPTMVVRGVMRLGASAGEGSVDIENGHILAGVGKISGDVGSAILLAEGGAKAVIDPIRAAKVRPAQAAARETIVKTIREAKTEAAPAMTVAEEAPPPGSLGSTAVAERAEAPARAAGYASAQAELLEKHWDDLQTLKAEGEARTPAGVARLAEQAANDPGLMVAMERAPTPTPSPARSAALGLGGTLEDFAAGRGVPYQNWTGTLTRRSTAGANFGRALTDALRNAEGIHFDLTGMEDLAGSFRKGRGGFKYESIGGETFPTNATNTELATVLRNRSLRNKTTFWRNGKKVNTLDVLEEAQVR